MEAIGITERQARTVRDAGVGLATTYLAFQLLAGSAELSQGASFATMLRGRGVPMLGASVTVAALAGGKAAFEKIQQAWVKNERKGLIPVFSNGEVVDCTICLDDMTGAWVVPMNGGIVEGCYHKACLRSWIVDQNKTTLPNSMGPYSEAKLNREPTFTDAQIKALMVKNN